MDKEYIKSIIQRTKEFQVLYIEDNETQRNQTLKMFEDFFDDILSAKNGHEGYELFKKNQKNIKLIFSDIKMPIMDGITMCKKIRQMDTIIPIVILSAHDDKELLFEGIKIGIDGYITKPYTFESITEVIAKILKKTHSLNIKYLNYGYYWDNEEENLYNKEHEVIKISKNERALIKLLVSVNNKIVSSLDIENEVFDDFNSNNKRVRNLVSKLNIKLQATLIQSVYAEGYKIALSKNF